jgi:hypothetical protein
MVPVVWFRLAGLRIMATCLDNELGGAALRLGISTLGWVATTSGSLSPWRWHMSTPGRESELLHFWRRVSKRAGVLGFQRVRGTNGAAGFKGDGHPDLFLVSSVCYEVPAELWLAMRLQVVVKGHLKKASPGQDAT